MVDIFFYKCYNNLYKNIIFFLKKGGEIMYLITSDFNGTRRYELENDYCMASCIFSDYLRQVDEKGSIEDNAVKLIEIDDVVLFDFLGDISCDVSKGSRVISQSFNKSLSKNSLWIENDL